MNSKVLLLILLLNFVNSTVIGQAADCDMCHLKPLGESIYFDNHQAVDSIFTLIQDQPDYQDYLNLSLTVSCIFDKKSLTKKFLDLGASVHAGDHQAIISALTLGRKEVLSTVILAYDGELPWDEILPYHQVAYKFPDLMKFMLLLFSGVDVSELLPPDYEELINDEDRLFELYVSTDETPFIQCIDTLLSYGAPIDLLNDENLSALDVCLDAGHPNTGIIAKMMQNGFSSNLAKSDSDLILLAARFNNWEFIKAQLTKNPTLVNQPGTDGRLVLQTALVYGHEALADTLLAYGADMTKVDTFKISAAHAVAIGNDTAFFLNHKDQLLNQSLLPNYQNYNAFDLSLIYANEEIFTLYGDAHLDTLKIDETVFAGIDSILAVEYESFALSDVQIKMLNALSARKQFENKGTKDAMLLTKIKDSECLSEHARRHLLQFIFREKFDFMYNALIIDWAECLSDSQMKVLLRSSTLQESLLFHFASDSSDLKWVDELELDSIKLDTVMNGHTATYKAALYENWDMVKRLVDKGANPNFSSYDRSILGLALYAGSSELVTYLVNHGAILTQDETVRLLNAQSRLSNINPALVSTIAYLNMLRQQILHFNSEDPFLLNQEITTTRVSINRFENSKKFLYQSVSLSLDQSPRFWSIFPMSFNKSYERCFTRVVYGCIEFDVDQEFRYWKYDNTTYDDVSFSLEVPDFGRFPGLDLGSWGSAGPQELKTKANYSFTILPCGYTSGAPTCYPFVEFEYYNFYDKTPIKLTQPNAGIDRSLNDRIPDTLDRSKGAIHVSTNIVTPDRIWMDLDLKLNHGPVIPVPNAIDFEARMNHYKLIYDAYLKISKNEGVLNNWLTYQHISSEWALQKNFHLEISDELSQSVQKIASIRSEIKDLYVLLNTHISNPNPINLLIVRLKEIVMLVNEYDVQQSLNRLINQLENENDPNAQLGLISSFLKTKVFTEIDLILLKIQVLSLELSQYLTKQELDHELRKIRQPLQVTKPYWNAQNFFLRETDNNSKGKTIIKYLK
ncbi:ankyrin repeat domain-containing protein [Reichenbachiella sp.]